MMKLAFFDMDGTLCLPNYETESGTTIGFTETDWIAFCIRHGEDTYEKCRPLPKVGAYAAKLKEEGTRVFVLTGALTSIEAAAKKKYVRTHFPGVFEDVIAVPDEDRKLAVLRIMAKEYNLSPSEILLVEDTYTTILRANAEGFRTMHVSEFLV